MYQWYYIMFDICALNKYFDFLKKTSWYMMKVLMQFLIPIHQWHTPTNVGRVSGLVGELCQFRLLNSNLESSLILELVLEWGSELDYFKEPDPICVS